MRESEYLLLVPANAHEGPLHLEWKFAERLHGLTESNKGRPNLLFCPLARLHGQDHFGLGRQLMLQS